ncbi:class I SAM-dependent methyltransferase [bacterium]|nr:class I SAM-dependent methyltransferase [bacterium]MBU1994041.1 class I SAM-dependent methyltransferase [bacterium]
MTHSCPLCDGLGSVFYKKNDIVFYQCENCLGIFVDKIKRLDEKSEKMRYEIHENDVENQGYQKFVSPITSAIMRDYTPESQGLDFGAGTGPVISKILQDNGFFVKQYDPFFHNFPQLLEERYDYIACCEVIEHFYHPKKDFLLLKKLLKPNAKLYCMTDIYSEKIDFSSWYYKNDPTHVFFYHLKTLEWIKNELGFSDVKIEKRLITLSN